MRKAFVRTGLTSVAIIASSPAHAAIVQFSGDMSATAVVSPSGACAPLPLQGVISNGTGTSSFGSFTYSHTACLQGGVGPVNGAFLIDFGMDELSGIFAGQATASSTAGVFDQIFNYTITGGTGQFIGATGSFVGVGTVDTRNPPPRVTFNFTSTVPEPSTWGMMLLGFMATGLALRRRSRRGIPQAA